METASAPTISPPPSHLFHRVQDGLRASGGGDLFAYIAECRALPDPIPYRRIAIDLTNLSGVDITHEAPRRWYLHYRAQFPAQPETPRDPS